MRMICSSAIIFEQSPDTLRVSELAPQGLAESVYEVHIPGWKSSHQLLLWWCSMNCHAIVVSATQPWMIAQQRCSYHGPITTSVLRPCNAQIWSSNLSSRQVDDDPRFHWTSDEHLVLLSTDNRDTVLRKFFSCWNCFAWDLRSTDTDWKQGPQGQMAFPLESATKTIGLGGKMLLLTSSRWQTRRQSQA